MRILLLIVPVLLLLAGCSSDRDIADLKQFMQETLDKPRGRIAPIPVFNPYEYFSYSASGLRSPFELPVVEEVEILSQQGRNIHPDTNRRKEHLERFTLGSLSMMGTLQKKEDGVIWALIKDGNGSVVRIKAGNYMGQNHGRVTEINEQYIKLIETVPNGVGGWIERPRTLAIDGLVGE